MEKGNVLVIGNSGVGKSTLINAVLGENMAETGWGISGTTSSLEIYESTDIPFRIIDTIGFEPSFFKEQKAIYAVKKWSRDCAKNGNTDNQINVIWFCVDGCARKLFDKAIKDLSMATYMWPSVPIVVVITKSYSVPERIENVEMVRKAFANQKRYAKNLKEVLPVVAATYELNADAFAPPEGITELIDVTNALMPEGIKAAEKDISKFILNRKRALAQSVIGISAAAGITVGAVPIPFADAIILSPVEVAEINALSKIYGINKDNSSKRFLNSIVEVGTVSVAAKTAISALKAIPGINLAASILNAIIAGSIIVVIGEGAVYAFEKIYSGEKSIDDIDWITKFMESKLSTSFVNKVTEIVKGVSESGTKDVASAISELVASLFSKSSSNNQIN